MNPNDKLDELFPLPKGMKLQIRKFGQNPATPLKTMSTGDRQTLGQEPTPLFRWEDSTLKLSAVLYEDPGTGKMTCHVLCSDPTLLNKAAAPVALFGKREGEMILKTIKLNQPDPPTGGCRGSAEFGLLKDAIEKLGTEMGLIVFLSIEAGSA
jgi:hypothetical protein